MRVPAIFPLLAIAALLGLALVLASPPTILTTVGPSIGLVEEISRTQLSGIAITASPRCWAVALNALSEFIQMGAHSSGANFCAEMTQLQQDVLALELARCHMEKSRTPFIVDGDDLSAEDCAGRNLVDQSRVDACLAHLDTNSYNVYVQFTMHVQQLCVRFTDELVAARKEQAALLLAQSSHAVSKQLANLMEKNDRLIDKVAEQQELLGNQSLKMQQFNEVIENMREDLSSTTDYIRPIQSIVTHMTQGFSWLASLLHFLVALNVVWLLTMNKRSRRARSALVNQVLFEALLEILSHWAVYNDYLRKDDQVKAVALWRKTFLVVELCTYVFGTILSFFCRRSGGDEADVIADLKASQAQMFYQVTQENAEAQRQMLNILRRRGGADTGSITNTPNPRPPPHPALRVGISDRRQRPVHSPVERRRYSLPPPQGQQLQFSLPNILPSRAVPVAAVPRERSEACSATLSSSSNASKRRKVTPDARKRKRQLEPDSSTTASSGNTSDNSEEDETSGDEGASKKHKKRVKH